MLVSSAGRLVRASEMHPRKAESPMVVIFGILIDTSEVHPRKAAPPMTVTLAGTFTWPSPSGVYRQAPPAFAAAASQSILPNLRIVGSPSAFGQGSRSPWVVIRRLMLRKGWTGFGQGRDLVKLVHCSSNLLAGAALVSNSFRPFRPPADVRCRSERAGLMAGRLPQRVLRLGRHSPTVWLVTYAVERGQAASSQNSWNDFQVRAARASHACPAHSLIQVSRTSVTHRLVRALAAATAARAIAAPQADMYHSCACLAGGSRGGPLASQQASFE